MKELYYANIFHQRFLPTVNKFRYSGFYIKFDIDKRKELAGPMFRHNRFHIFSFYDQDHGDRKGGDLRKWAEDKLEKAGIHNFRGKILLQAFPRVFGHTFNPVSFWYCLENEEIRAIICEVNNTFKESHNYVLTNQPGENVEHLSKNFHVSPFYDVTGKYRFNFTAKNHVGIDLFFDNQLQLATYIKGKQIEWSTKNWFKVLLRFPFYSFIVLFQIHYQALKLYIKKNTFYSKPEKKDYDVTCSNHKEHQSNKA